MFVTEKRAKLVQLFNEVCPHAYSKWQASKYFLSHYRPQVIITLPENNDEMNKDFEELAKALIAEKIGEVEDGLNNSLRAHTELRANRLYFWFWNKVSKSKTRKETNLVRTSLANETWSTFAQEAFDYIGSLIGVLRGRWLTKYNEDGTVLNTKSRDTFMSQDILKDHKRFFHLQRNATKYCHDSIKAVKAIENKWNVEIHIHGQEDYSDTDCFSENGTKYYFQYHLDDKTEYVETCAYYSFWSCQFRNLHQERVYNSSLYPVGDPNVTPHSPLQDYVRYKHYDSSGWYEWEKAYDVDNSSYNEFYRLLCDYFFLYQEEIKANRKPWPKEFDYPTEPYRSKGCQYDEWDEDNWDCTEDEQSSYEYEEELNDYYDYEEDVKYFDASSIQSIHNISWKELSFEGIY